MGPVGRRSLDFIQQAVRNSGKDFSQWNNRMRFCSKRCLEGPDWLSPGVVGMQELSGRCYGSDTIF